MSVWPVIVALIINVASLAYITSIVKPKNSDSQTNLQILQELSSLRADLTATPTPSSAVPIVPVLGTAQEYAPGSLADLLTDAPTTPSATAKGFVVAKNITGADVYKENAGFSPIIDRLIPGQKYGFSSKLNNWYLVVLPNSGKNGWVMATDVYETQP